MDCTLNDSQLVVSSYVLPFCIYSDQTSLSLSTFSVVMAFWFGAKEKFKFRDHLLQKWNKTLFEQKHFINIGSSNVKCGRVKQLISNIKYLCSLMYLVNSLWPGRDLKQIQTMPTKLQGLLIIYCWEKRWILRRKIRFSLPTCMFTNPN